MSGSSQFHESTLAITESPNGDMNRVPSALLEGSPRSLPLLSPGALLSISPIAWWGDGPFFVSGLVLRGDAGGRAGCRVRTGTLQCAHLFPEPEQTGSRQGGCQRSVLSEQPRARGNQGLPWLHWNFWHCSAPGSSTCRNPSRYSRDLDLSLASTNKDAQVRRG